MSRFTEYSKSAKIENSLKDKFDEFNSSLLKNYSDNKLSQKEVSVSMEHTHELIKKEECRKGEDLAIDAMVKDPS